MKKYVLVGCGSRALMFIEALCDTFKDHSALVAVCDKNPGRLEYYKRIISEKGTQVACYSEDQFEAMLARYKPAGVIVCSMDRTHDEYICRALLNGCDVITEKPMTIDEIRCQKIIDAVKTSGRSLTCLLQLSVFTGAFANKRAFERWSNRAGIVSELPVVAGYVSRC